MWIIKMEAKNLIAWTAILVIIISNALAKKLNSSAIFDETWLTDTDLENELEQKRSGRGQWSPWSEWSACSRSCDGGVSQQFRRCTSPNGCGKGDVIRSRICNMHACPEIQDFRALQCKSYNDVPYDGTLYKWTPHHDYTEPCSLFCRGRPAHLPDDDATVETEGDESEHFDEPSVIVQLANRVQDGTRCRSGSLDMCIQGKCQRVGCDLKIGSTKKVDACGVCGGDGYSCSQPLYHWEMTPMSLCSVTCGGGYKMSQPICKNRVTNVDAENESLCSGKKPEPAVEECNTHSCPPRWIADEWSVCSRQCGGGFRQRPIVCVEETSSIKTVVPKELCLSQPKPPTREDCNKHDCPDWKTSEWSGCSVSCGTGLQIRSVECIDEDGVLSAICDSHSKPRGVQDCTTGISCDESDSYTQTEEPSVDDHVKETDDGESVEDDEEEEEEEDSSEPQDSSQISYNDQAPKYSNHQVHPLHHEETGPKAEKLISDPKPSVDPTFVKDNEWSSCSVTCGEGIRRKEWKCKIFLEYSKTIATVNDTLCEGHKPKDEIDHCALEPCVLPYGFDDQYPRDSIKVGVSEPGKTYVWREQGYTSCSASCLGGVEELIINCVREDNGKVVSPFLCSPETKPEARVRTCNDRPCPPRWNYSDYSPCSKSCGIGIKTREVQCIHEVTRGGENTMVVPNSMCPQPPPADRQYCNVLDCPVRWEVGEWSKCSHTCGYGVKDRKVECKQIMAQEHKIERPESMCPSAKPSDKKPCNVKPCPPEDPKPIIQSKNSTFIQHDAKKTKITLKVGGAAEVFFGTQVKIQCPVKRYNRTKIRWEKDRKPLIKSRKYRVSRKGALRVADVTFRDSGTYSCHAGLSSEEINIIVKAKPGMQAEDYDKYKDDSDRTVRERSETEFLTSADMTSEGSSVRKKQRERNRSKQKSPDGMQHADSSIMEDESQLVQQAQGGVPPSSNTATNSGNRNMLSVVPAMPYFQALISNLQYLWPFQEFSHSKGKQILMEKGLDYGIDLEQLEKDEPRTSRTSINDASKLTKNLLSSVKNENQNGFLLGNRTKENLKFEWKVTKWSECSQKCGLIGGLRQRTVQCLVRYENQTEHVDSALCENAGLINLDTYETCGIQECPKWDIGEWTLCQQSRCFGRNMAIQKREIICKYSNSSLSNNCDENDRPIERQECYNELCRGLWRVEPWSDCNAPCGKQGIKYRILQCVWYGTRRPAGNACRNQPRPAVMKVCKGPPCMSNLIDCNDTSRYCKNVHSMGLCRLHRYQLKCCKSCRLNIRD